MQDKRILRILFLVLLLVMVFATPGEAQSSLDEVIITNVDETAFPQVNVRFRALDRDRHAVTGLQGSSISVLENGEPMAMESLEEIEEGLWTHVIIDAGGGMSSSRWQNTKQALLNYVNSTLWMKEDLDKISITAVEASGPHTIIDFSSNADSISKAIESYQPPGGTEYSDAVTTTGDTLKSFGLIDEAIGQAQSILLMTPGLEKTTGLDSLQETVENGSIPIHTVLVREDERIPCSQPTTNEDGSVTVPACDEGLRSLALRSGGEYVHYTGTNSLNDLFQTLAEQRLQYDLSYRSYLSDSGTRQVQLSAGEGNNSTTAQHNYDIDVNPARVLIEQPRQGFVIDRKSEEYIEDLSELPGETYKVIANVIFPDNRRRLLRASLFADGELQTEVDYPGEDIELSWDLPTPTKIGDADHTLQVTVEDELGIVSTSPPIISKIRVTIPPKPQISPATALQELVFPESDENTTVIDQPPPVVEPIKCLIPEPICSRIERPIHENPLAFGSMVLAILAIGIAGVVYFNRGSGGLGGSLGKTFDEIIKTIRGQTRENPRAYLKVISGEDEIGESIPVYGDTMLGRVRGEADILFQQDGRGSPVSARHCTLIDDEDGWFIRDEGSTNGTFLEGHKLEPREEVELPDKSFVELAPKRMGGVQLEFLIADDDRNTRHS